MRRRPEWRRPALGWRAIGIGATTIAALAVAQIAVAAASKLLEREIDAKAHADLINKLATQI